MEVMRQREEGRQLTGRIEMDDAYLGGEQHGGTPGRGSENKVSFVAAVQTTESGQPHLACFSKRAFTKESLRELMGVPCQGTVDPSVTARLRPSPVRPGKLALQPEAQGAVQEVTNGLKHCLKRPRRGPAGHAGRNVGEH
jgi:hypothetical protein